MKSTFTTDGNDLVLSRLIDAPPDAIWPALTDTEMLKRWFVPRPWRLAQAVIEPRAGGRFLTEIVGPNGENDMGTSEGCILLAEPPHRLVWTDALSGGWRPNEKPFMTVILTLEPERGGTHFTARVLHPSAEDRQKHEEMGFAQGWGTIIEQLAELVE